MSSAPVPDDELVIFFPLARNTLLLCDCTRSCPELYNYEIILTN